ncbi:hypothetical protein, partial [Actinoplanes italicus]|uniref:hypothetical protein n=1 Tax=Actinoplanes italicus TaxID=113567 RepID=UPI001B805085
RVKRNLRQLHLTRRSSPISGLPQRYQRPWPVHLGSLTVEDDPDGTVDAADLAGSAAPGDAKLGPSANEAARP